MTTDSWVGNCPTCGTAGGDEDAYAGLARDYNKLCDRLGLIEKALADVRTLDEWAAKGHVWAVGFGPDGYWVCMGHYGASPDEARAKAAAWVRGLR